MTFKEWLKEVDLHCWSNYGISLYDLPDLETRDAFDAGQKPLEFFYEELGTINDLERRMA
ncbi:MAG: hypothetical protein IT206_04990 [Fimbriimonadaceae bacterium]|nr:hypothetical protein [Fimbriimonadaceae bacterium]